MCVVEQILKSLGADTLNQTQRDNTGSHKNRMHRHSKEPELIFPSFFLLIFFSTVNHPNHTAPDNRRAVGGGNRFTRTDNYINYIALAAPPARVDTETHSSISYLPNVSTSTCTRSYQVIDPASYRPCVAWAHANPPHRAGIFFYFGKFVWGFTHAFAPHENQRAYTL